MAKKEKQTKINVEKLSKTESPEEKVETKEEIEIRNKKQKKELFWILGLMAAAVVIFLIANSAFKEANQFEYQGLSFTKEKIGEIPIFHYYFYFTDKTGGMVRYNLYLRNDPRKNIVPFIGEPISLYDDVNTYVSINSTGLQACELSAIAISSLGNFLTESSVLVRSATPDEQEAESKNLQYATCESLPSNTVLLIQSADKTEIIHEGNCYTLNIANCEILESIEKFEVQAIIDAKSKEKLSFSS